MPACSIDTGHRIWIVLAENINIVHQVSIRLFFFEGFGIPKHSQSHSFQRWPLCLFSCHILWKHFYQSIFLRESIEYSFLISDLFGWFYRIRASFSQSSALWSLIGCNGKMNPMLKILLTEFSGTSKCLTLAELELQCTAHITQVQIPWL